MLKLEEIYAKIEGMEGGAEMVSALKAEFKTRNDEAARHRTGKNTVEEQLKKFRESLGIGETDDADAILNDVAALRKAGHKPDDIQKLHNQLKSITDKMTAAENKAKASEEKRISQVKFSKALEAMQDTIRPAEMAQLILSNIVVKDDDTIAFLDGDVEVAFTDGIKKWKEARPEFVKSSTAPGAGSNGNGGAPAVNPWAKKTLNLTQQGEILQKNPALAQALKEAAAKENN